MPRKLVLHLMGKAHGEGKRLLEGVLQDCVGVTAVYVSFVTGEIFVELQDGARDPDLQLLNKQLAPHGYALSTPAVIQPARVHEIWWMDVGRRLSAVFKFFKTKILD